MPEIPASQPLMATVPPAAVSTATGPRAPGQPGQGVAAVPKALAPEAKAGQPGQGVAAVPKAVSPEAEAGQPGQGVAAVPKGPPAAGQGQGPEAPSKGLLELLQGLDAKHIEWLRSIATSSNQLPVSGLPELLRQGTVDLANQGQPKGTQATETQVAADPADTPGTVPTPATAGKAATPTAPNTAGTPGTPTAPKTAGTPATPTAPKTAGTPATPTPAKHMTDDTLSVASEAPSTDDVEDYIE